MGTPGVETRHRGSEVSLTGTKARGLFYCALFFSIFTNLLMLTGPLFMLQIYDRVLGSRSEETLVALFALVAFLYSFYWLLEFARGRVMARVGARFQADRERRRAAFRWAKTTAGAGPRALQRPRAPGAGRAQFGAGC